MDLNGTLKAFRSFILKPLAARPGTLVNGEMWYETASGKAFIQEAGIVKHLTPIFTETGTNVQTSTTSTTLTLLNSMSSLNHNGICPTYFHGNFFLNTVGAELQVVITIGGSYNGRTVGRFYIPSNQLINTVIPIHLSSLMYSASANYTIDVRWSVTTGTAYCMERNLLILDGGA